MGFLDRFRRNLPAEAPNGEPVHYRQFGPASTIDVLGLSVEDLWRTQPYLRTVVTFLARNIAQLGVHSFERVSDTDRRRVHDSTLPRLLRRPNDRMTTYELIFSLVADMALYDEALWLVQPDAEAESGWSIMPIPPAWVTARGGGSAFGADWYDVLPPGGQRASRIPASEMLIFRGWNPNGPTHGSSPVDALKQILAEQMHAHSYRQQIWERGGRVGAVLTRPAGATWSPEARERFTKDWRDKWTGDDGPKAGGTPILEDGMTLQRVGMSAHEEEWVAAAKLSLSIVASVYHVNPTMVGLLDNANYSNVREFRRMLYGDTLGPIIASIEARINAFLVPRVESDSGIYVEFNIAEKLQGSFEEQAAVMQTMVGAPIMTRNEARARFNMTSLDGVADELVTPLNVLIGGQASPRDSGTQNETPKSRQAHVKAAPIDAQRARVAQVLSAFFDRQGKTVLSAIGAGGDWWDENRWNRELADDLARVAHTLAAIVGPQTAEALGYEAGAYDPDMTVNFFAAVAADRAAGINATTREQLDELVAAEDGEPAQVFETAKNSRTPVAAESLATFAAGFGTAEAARQIAKANGTRMVKTWRTGSNPRSSHARMDGETVPVGEKFSNGMDHPGQGDGDDANCNCSIDVSEEAP